MGLQPLLVRSQVLPALLLLQERTPDHACRGNPSQA